jgi:Uma2 family endonuclease
MSILTDPKEVFYPESDGKPMAETDLHRDLLLLMVSLLKTAFPEAYASGNICLYYEEGNPKKMISPDSLLCLSQRPHQKRVYKAWEENHQLDLVIEFSSFGTKRVDHHQKKKIYADILQVPWYVIFDPHGLYLNVFRLTSQGYVQQEAEAEGLFRLDNLGISIGVDTKSQLRLFDRGGKLIPTSSEKAEQEREKAEQEREKAEQEREKAKSALQQAEQEREKAEQEHLRAENAEQKLAQLTQKLRELGISVE